MHTPDVPTLSKDGWVSDPRAKLIRLLQYMIYNESDQSDYFKTFDIHTIVRKYARSPGALASSLEVEIAAYLETYFDHVDCNVYTKYTDVAEEYNLEMEISALDQGKHATLENTVTIRDGGLVPIKD